MQPFPRICFLVIWTATAATAIAAPQYQIFDLGVLEVNDLDSRGYGVSPAGVAVGSSGTGNGSQAFTWTQGSGLAGLPLLNGRDSSIAFSANDNGTVVGSAFNENNSSTSLPVIWQNGVVAQLPLPQGYAVGRVFAVNASGIAVGSVGAGGEWEQAAIYTVDGSSVITVIPPNAHQFATAYGINDSGRIVGVGFLPSNPGIRSGIVYDLPTNTIFDVGTLPGANTTMALAVNNNGQVVGSSNRQPFIWTEGSGMVAIPLLPDKDRGDAQGVNSAGWVVGTDLLVNSAYAPFLYDGTTTYRLADLLPPGSGWVLNGYAALNINDNGVIVGTGVHNNVTRAFMMVPVTGTPTPAPTPSTTPLPTATPSTTPLPSATPSTTPNEPHFEVSAPVVVLPGVPFDITVTAKLFNNVLTGYTGTVHFTSTASSGAHLPPDSTLTSGVGTFSVTFDTPGNYTITARDTVNPSMIGTSGTIFVAVIDPPTPTVGPTATPSASPTPSPTPTLTPTPPPNPTPTPSATASPTPPTQALNLSTRLRVQTGDNVGIGGFIITGTGPKHVLLRAIGPSLTASGVPDALADPVLELHGPSPFVTIVDDNWRDDPAQEALIKASGIQPTNDLEAAIDANLDPGTYTATIMGKNNTSGVGLVEVYDLSQGAPAKLANISTRAFVGTGSNVVIGGFFLGGGNADRIAVRGIGPSLTDQGVPNALADPVLELRDGNGALLVSNNDWHDNAVQAAELIAAGLAPTNDLESGISTTLPPGPYTAMLAGQNNGVGVGLVEIYDRGASP